MPLAGVVAGLLLAAALLAVGCLLWRRAATPPCCPAEDGDFGDRTAGYHKEPPAWPVDDWPPEAQEEEETCPECNAVLIYAARPDDEEDEPPGAG
jgi:hypothetical protein